MKTKKSFGHFIRTLCLVALLMVGASACSSTGSDVVYYVALGDSLAVGVQPDAAGQNMETDQGYADQLFQILLANTPNLQLMKFGCPGETTVTMAEGGICDYPEGSQLDEAVKFLEENRDKIFLVTIDVGVNDVLSSDCIDQSDPANPVIDVECITDVLFPQVGSNLSFILSTIFSAVDRSTPVIGMNYYNTFLALYLQGTPEAIGLAQLSDVLLQGFNFMVLQPVYDLMGFAVADVYTAFNSSDFMTMVPFPPPFGMVPLNVATICQLTYMCIPPPIGPNIHANPDGYGLIAQTFFTVFTSLGF